MATVVGEFVHRRVAAQENRLLDIPLVLSTKDGLDSSLEAISLRYDQVV